jgi:hypothetical protein
MGRVSIATATGGSASTPLSGSFTILSSALAARAGVQPASGEHHLRKKTKFLQTV